MAATSETPAKRARAKKVAKAQAPEAQEVQEGKEAQETATPMKPTKRKSKESLDDAANAKKAKRDKGTPLARSPTPRELEPPAGSRLLKLLSVNVAGLRAVLAGDKGAVLRTLVEREAPHVLCLNEHKLKEEDVVDVEAQMRELLPAYGTVHWSCSTAKKGYSGVAMLLRADAEVLADPASLAVRHGMGAAHEADPIIAQEGRLLTLELPGLTVISTYVPNSGTDLKRLEYRTEQWDRALGKYVSGIEGPVLLLGDMNCCVGVRDIWNMHDRPDFPEGLAAKVVEDQYTGLTSLRKFAGLTPEERRSFPQLLEEANLVDTFRALHPGASGVFSYFSQRVVQNRPMNQGLRLDYVLASPSLCRHFTGGEESAATPRVHDSFILDEDDLVADHAAIGCHILLPPQ